MKQETLEEELEQNFKDINLPQQGRPENIYDFISNYVYSTYKNQSLNEILTNAIIFGAKWKQERSYSGEEVLDIFDKWFCYIIDEDVEIKLPFSKWFKQFKKK